MPTNLHNDSVDDKQQSAAAATAPTTKTWKPDENQANVSTTFSEFSNNEAMVKIKKLEVNKLGKKLIPKYLKDVSP